MSLFAEKMRQLRGERSLGDVQLGTDISRIEISRYERGKYYPTADKLKKLAAFYGVSYSELRGLQLDETIKDPDERQALIDWVQRLSS